MSDDRSSPVVPDPWQALRAHTPARIALGRCGSGLPTAELLRFGAAHAAARDAVHRPLDVAALQADLQAAGWSTLHLHSRAPDRPAFLRRPDWGRRLAPEDAQRLQALAEQTPDESGHRQGQGHRHSPAHGPDIALVLGDGLSAAAAQVHAEPTLRSLRTHLAPGLRLAPVVIVQQARVAVADEVGELLGARAVLILLGERPGLSSPDSLGAYLTFAPRVGCTDAQRNCVSNIRPAGLAPAEAGRRLAWLLQQALRLRLSGVGLKDQSDVGTLPR